MPLGSWHPPHSGPARGPGQSRRLLAVIPLLIALIGWLSVYTPAVRHTKAGPAASPKEVIGFYTEGETSTGDPSSLDVLLAQAPHLSTVIGFWYRLDENDPGAIRLEPGADEWTIRMVVALARQRGVQVQALVHNLYESGLEAGRRAARRLLTDPAAQERFLDSLVDLVQRFELAGINIDIESVYPEDRAAFTALMGKVAARLHEVGAILSIDVPAKTVDNPRHGWSGAFDYAALGRVADQLIIMSYDEHGSHSGPGPIASYPWVEAVMAYAASQVAPEKLYMGIPGYGFDWTQGERPRYLSHRRALATAELAGVDVRWDTASRTPTFTYTDSRNRLHEVWFEDARATQHKLALVEHYNLAGVALWRMGLEDASLWRTLATAFPIKKSGPVRVAKRP